MQLKHILAVLPALVVSQVAAETCGSAPYDPDLYYCFDSDFLCPIIDGEAYLRCGDGCYSAREYNCVNGSLVQRNPQTDDTLAYCGAQPYRVGSYYCFDPTTDPFLCPTNNPATFVRCGGSCYLPSQYDCVNGQLVQPGTGDGTCVDEYGDCEIGGSAGGITIARCCGDNNFACVAGTCRDLRKLGSGPSKRAFGMWGLGK